MKAISYIVAILVAGGAAFFSLDHKGKFEELQKVRLSTIESNRSVTADTSVANTNIKDERAQLVAAQDKQDGLKTEISQLKATANVLKSDNGKLDDELGVQTEEFTQLEKTLAEVNVILSNLGGGVTLDNLAEKIAEIEESKKAKEIRLEELETLVTGANKVLANSRAESDRLTNRGVERNARISRNSMEAVITAVNQDWGFLVIGAGSNSGFTPQTSLLVERNGRTIGRVRPSSIEPTQTIAEIDLKNMASGVRIQPGDRVILSAPTSN